MAKLMGTTEESTSGVTDHRRIHATSVERNAPISSLGKPIARSKSMTRAFKERAGYRREVDELDPEQCVERQRPSQRKNSENHLLIHEGWSERHQGVCLVTRYTARFSVGKCPLWYRGKADDLSLHSDDDGHAISDSPIKGSLNSGTSRTPDV